MRTSKWLRGAAWLFVLFLAACQTAQETGRSQLILVSESQEKQLGTDAYQEVRAKTPLSNNRAWQDQLRRVGQRIASAAAKPDYQWEFNVLQGNDINAFCLPGGKVAFWEGIMPVAQDDNGVAVIMGHEIAHAILRHGAERMSQAMGLQAIGQVISVGVGKAAPGMRDGVLQAYGLGATVGAILPWGRTQESEADRVGLTLMAKAGYDPNSAIAFWERMSKASSGNKPPEFLSTHPSDATRIEQIKQWIPEAQQYYRR